MRRLRLLCAIALLLLPTAARAGVRRFTFLYEAIPSTPGSVEIENYVTFKTGTMAIVSLRSIFATNLNSA